MPSLSQHQSLEYVKALYMGDSGVGKTGSLVSLLNAGYDLRIFDFDNNLGSLVQYAKLQAAGHEDQVRYQTFTDKMKGIDNPIVMTGNAAKVLPFIDGTPKAFSNGLKQLNHWKEEGEDLGVPSTWGPKTVVVIDTLTTMAQAAFRYGQAMNPAAREPQTYYFTAQQLVMQVIALLCSADFRCNVLVIAHIDYSKDKDGTLLKGFPRSIGSALGDQIGVHFNSILMAESVGQGTSIKRQIRTNSTGLVSLKNPVSFKVADTLPLETGLATFFEAVKKV